ncbi:MAG: peptidoglycan-binding protein [Eubacterium sp.]|nr:peptidoglycan-binding protein [Eubacterium sp.]
MQKYRLFFVRLLLAIVLSGSLVPSIPLLAPDAAQPAVTVFASTSYNKATVKKVQKKLNRKGYDCGTPDGIRGSKTSDAIREYQKDHDLKVTGTVNASLLKSLNIKGVKETSSQGSGSSARVSDTRELTVYVTDTGSKYHRDGCRYLSRSKHAIDLSVAQSLGYDACSVCRP